MFCGEPLIKTMLFLAGAYGEIFARNMRQVGREKGYSQEAVPLETGVDRTYIGALERCVYGASIDMVGTLEAVLGVETATLHHRPAKAGREKPLPPGADPCWEPA